MSQVNVNKIISPDQAQNAGPSIDIASNGNISMDTDTFFVDSTNDRFGTGTASPNRTLDLQGSGGASFNAGVIFEKCNISTTPLTGTVNHDAATSNAYYHSAQPSGNWTYNVRYSGSASLDSKMSTGEYIGITYVVPCGSSSRYQTAFQIDGSSQTVEYFDRAPEQAGGGEAGSDDAATTGFDSYYFQIHKTGSGSFTVLGALTHNGSYT
ncbi:sericin 1 precursor-like protein [Synechococcus phage S-CAM22]|uniref:Sericin 1-like protein n=1 Tax=Synechococcus phage S-CAM22 TaxID=1883365 RepID=A0A1D8KR11_9CAUD|nr:sericin 1 precursor-like protein [Synechococcus phage S-CAM22]AOV61080.1 sericin 1 precursor-like protein [Synechococcus phage S-CAM22]AOV61294.1 sericin 1 precursor-like protein [Synechococcus phage S-CAM22]